ncbi:uncharacterized protein LOC9636351 [Selaginella moellendorffii]|uniref:uncharacterized protein LOC9636351 n=1 Tax=Selaginella moellendorffii TaxID=88036 RepID=UPI000D1CC533|nr:uncharacterized protein LOC9636351 [Selaginella moellendorffii]|eukprot:XP_024517788.1 uncharacterized protein LOC9636351 [Selaginella moellendorffii]
MRGRRKHWSLQQVLQLCQRKTCILLLGLISIGTFASLTFHGAGRPVLRRSLPVTAVLDWLSFTPPSQEEEDRNVVSKKFEFVIQVLAYDRYDSLRRCLRSLAIADYGSDTVNLVVHLDHFKPVAAAAAANASSRRLLSQADNIEDYGPASVNSTEVGVINMQDEAEIEPEEIELSSDPVERNLQQARQLLNFLDRFKWPHGSKQVHYRTQNVGLQVQWLEAWWPSSDHQFALVVEDDMQLSPLYYRYVRSVIAKYYYDPANFDPSIFGITLQRPRFVPGKGGNRIALDNSTRLFLYQLVGTWGQILFPKPWREFRQWFDEHKTKEIEPIIDGMVTTDWYKKLGNNIWTPWFLKFVHSHGYFNVYTNFLRGRALSVSHRTRGVNYHKDAGPDSKLIKRHGTPDIDMWEIPALSTLKWYDYCFHQVFRNRLLNGFKHLEALLSDIHSENEVILVNSVGVDDGLVRNWLCQMAVLRTKNYLLLGRDYNTSSELARRGHPVLLTDETPGGDEEKEDDHGTIYSIRAMQQIIAMGYSVWFARPDVTWPSHPLSSSNTSVDEEILAVLVGKSFHSGLFFARSCDKTKLFMKTLEELLREKKFSLGMALWSGAGSVKIGAPAETLVSKNWTAPAGARILLRPESSREKNGTKQALEAAGLWLVDEELACKQVICRARSRPSIRE